MEKNALIVIEYNDMVKYLKRASLVLIWCQPITNAVITKSGISEYTNEEAR